MDWLNAGAEKVLVCLRFCKWTGSEVFLFETTHYAK